MQCGSPMGGALHQRPLTEERQHPVVIGKATDRADEWLETVIVVHLLFLAEVLDDAWPGATAGAHAFDQAELGVAVDGLFPDQHDRLAALTI